METQLIKQPLDEESVHGGGDNKCSRSNDVLTGGSAGDVMFAGAGADTLDGGAGNSAINGENARRYKKRSCLRILLLARRPIRFKGTPIQRWQRFSAVQTGLYGSAPS